MSANKYRPHIHILPEDDANRQIANGFLLNPDLSGRVVQVLPPAGGWKEVLKQFKGVHEPLMNRYPERRIILLVDLDDRPSRLSEIKSEIPSAISHRVFILGVLSEPERLRTALGKTFENIGKDLAKDCVDDTREAWGHDLLKHNETELSIMDNVTPSIKEILFPGHADVSSLDT